MRSTQHSSAHGFEAGWSFGCSASEEETTVKGLR
jgi:hypothetical protein